MSSQNFLLQNIVYIFTILGVVAAITVYIFNSLAVKRQRRIDNIERYLKIHAQIFSKDSYPVKNVAAMEKDSFKREESNKEMELLLNRFLSDIEHLALLQNACAVPKEVNAYMVGWFAKRIYPILNDREKAEPYWLLATQFLRETKVESEKIDKMKLEDFVKYLKKMC
jgi:hypothetical protein